MKMSKIEIFKELIEIGSEIEMIDYNAGKFGAYGFNRNKIYNLRKKARRRIAKLAEMGIDVWTEDYSFVDEMGTEWELDYALDCMW